MYTAEKRLIKSWFLTLKCQVKGHTYLNKPLAKPAGLFDYV